MNTELWHAIAAGLLNALVAKAVSITNRDSRSLLYIKQTFPDWLRVESWPALGYVATDDTINLLWDEVRVSIVYAPAIREQAVPLVENAAVSSGTTLTADAPPSGYTTFVYEWDFTEFTELGELVTNSEPGSGTYVLANKKDDESELLSIPSLFMTIL